MESFSILLAWNRGYNDAFLKKPYKNPYKKNSQKDKFKAYKDGYQNSISR